MCVIIMTRLSIMKPCEEDFPPNACSNACVLLHSPKCSETPIRTPIISHVWDHGHTFLESMFNPMNSCCGQVSDNQGSIILIMLILQLDAIMDALIIIKENVFSTL